MREPDADRWAGVWPRRALEANGAPEAAPEAAPDDTPPPDAKPLAPAAPWVSYPVAALPSPLHALALAGARSLAVDPAMIAVPGLGVAAGCIGAARLVSPRDGWNEPATLWTTLVVRPGTGKSPALDLVAAPLEALAAELAESNAELRRSHAAAVAAFTADMAGWRARRAKMGIAAGAAPREPDDPAYAALRVDDVTTEALVEALAANPRGLVVVADELSGWVAGFDAYRRTSGLDRSRWLRLHGARSVEHRRKGRPPIVAARATCSVAGCITPAVAARSIYSADAIGSGLAARLLTASPPTLPWSPPVSVPRAAVEAWAATVETLFGLEAADPPVTLRLDRDAVDELATLERDARAAAMVAASEGDAAAWSKAPAHALRLALLVTLTEAEDPRTARTVDADAMARGITLARWHVAEALRIAAALAAEDAEPAPELDPDRARRAFLAERGPLTAAAARRDSRAFRELGDTAAVEAWLDAEADAGRVARSAPPSGRGGALYAVSRVTCHDSTPPDREFAAETTRDVTRDVRRDTRDDPASDRDGSTPPPPFPIEDLF